MQKSRSDDSAKQKAFMSERKENKRLRRKTSGCYDKQPEGISVKEKEKEKWEFMKSYRQEV